METLRCPRVMISGERRGFEQTLIGIGIAHELRRRGVSVSCCIVGPHLAKAVIYRRIANRYVRVFDQELLSSSQNLVDVYQAGVGADLILIEGAAGLYDSRDAGSMYGSDAEVAGLTRSPVALTINGERLGGSLAAIVRGYASMTRGFGIAGAILTSYAEDPHRGINREYYDATLQSNKLPFLLGALPPFEGELLEPFEGFTQAKNRSSFPRQFFLDIAATVREHLDIDRLLEVADTAPEVQIPDYEHRPSNRRCRIAVADDVCFGLCFQDNLSLLRYHGAELVTFSPIADVGLPRGVGGVYLTGGYLKTYGEELAKNEDMKKSLREFAEGGGVLFSEGGGTAYLCEQFRAEKRGEFLSGVGLIPGNASGDERGFGYAEAITIDDSVLGETGLIVKIVDTGEWRVTLDRSVQRVLRTSREGEPAIHCGYSPTAQSVAMLGFAHFGSNLEFARSLVEAAQVVESL